MTATQVHKATRIQKFKKKAKGNRQMGEHLRELVRRSAEDTRQRLALVMSKSRPVAVGDVLKDEVKDFEVLTKKINREWGLAQEKMFQLGEIQKSWSVGDLAELIDRKIRIEPRSRCRTIYRRFGPQSAATMEFTDTPSLAKQDSTSIGRRVSVTAVIGQKRQFVVSQRVGFQTAGSGIYQPPLKKLAAGSYPIMNDIEILQSLGPGEDKLMLMDEGQMGRLQAAVPGLVIDENLPYKTCQHPFLDEFSEFALPASGEKRTVVVRAVDGAEQTGLRDVTVYLIPDRRRKGYFKGITGVGGECRIQVTASVKRFDRVALKPQRGYWSRGLNNVSIEERLDVPLQRLVTAPARYDWGHKFAGMQDGLAGGGRGVRIGVIDTGISRDHEGLRPSGGYNCVEGEDTALWYRDDRGHGTHCAGIIAAIAAQANRLGVKGYAPRAEIRSYRVFTKDTDAMTFDIVTAIKRATEDGCDILNMSFGMSTPQTTIRIRTDVAYERGVMCIAAAGNQGGEVIYPANFRGVVGVGAFGRFGTYPEDSLHKEAETPMVTADKAHFMARFSNFGADGVDFCAPGVAVLSTVPGGYSAYDGTSMACPHVAGVAALALASHPDILNAKRDAERVERLLEVLKATPMGFGADREGAGCLTLGQLLPPQG